MNGRQTTPVTLHTVGAGLATRVLAPAVSCMFTLAVHGSAVAQPASEPAAASAPSAQAPEPAAEDAAAVESLGTEYAEDESAAASPAQQPAYREEALDANALAKMSLEELLQVQIVEAASRRQQTIHDAPSSITVLDRGQIEQSGAVEVAELMRRVPGAHVVRQTNNAYDVALRNQTYRLGNRPTNISRWGRWSSNASK
jgi:outer membrane receptor protein involved in Fe transport